MRRWRDDRGVSTVELAVLAPALMLVCMLILQFGLWFNAREVALAAAQAGATTAREDAGGPGVNWQAAATAKASQYYHALHTSLLSHFQASASRTAPGNVFNPTTNVYVTVSGKSVTLLFWLHLSVSATAGGPVECFRPATATGSCG